MKRQRGAPGGNVKTEEGREGTEGSGARGGLSGESKGVATVGRKQGERSAKSTPQSKDVVCVFVEGGREGETARAREKKTDLYASAAAYA